MQAVLPLLLTWVFHCLRTKTLVHRPSHQPPRQEAAVRLTFTGASIGCCNIPMRRTGTSIAAYNINALEDAEVPDGLGTLVNICGNTQVGFCSSLRRLEQPEKYLRCRAFVLLLNYVDI